MLLVFAVVFHGYLFDYFYYLFYFFYFYYSFFLLSSSVFIPVSFHLKLLFQFPLQFPNSNWIHNIHVIVPKSPIECNLNIELNGKWEWNSINRFIFSQWLITNLHIELNSTFISVCSMLLSPIMMVMTMIILLFSFVKLCI